MFVRTRLKYVEQPLPGVQTVGATLRGMPVRKGRGAGVGRNAYFSRPTLLIKKPTTGSRTKDGRPRLLIQRSMENLIFFKLNLFPIFVVDKVKKKKKQKSCHLQDHEEFFYYHSGRCHAMRIQHQYAIFSRILQF